MKKGIEQGIIVSIGNPKGGVEKSRITSMVATYIHRKWGKELKILVVDCDGLQESLHKLRKTEFEIPLDTEEENYRLLQIDSEDLPKLVEFLIDEYDIIFVDLPENIKQPGVIQCFHFVDVLITPTQIGSTDLQLTFDFIKMYKELIIPTREKFEFKTLIYGLFSKVDLLNLKFKVLNSEETRKTFPIEFLQNFIPESKAVFQNIFTTFVDENYKYENYKKLSEEILSILGVEVDLFIDNFFNDKTQDHVVEELSEKAGISKKVELASKPEEVYQFNDFSYFLKRRGNEKVLDKKLIPEVLYLELSATALMLEINLQDLMINIVENFFESNQVELKKRRDTFKTKLT